MEALDVIEIEKERLSGSVIESFCQSKPCSVRLSKVVASEAVLIREKRFIGLEVFGSSFKEALTFIDCRFDSNVSFRQIKSAAPVSFINCEFNGNVTLFGSEIKGSISFIGSRIAGRLLFDGCSTPKIDVQGVTSESFIISAQEISACIASIGVKNVTVTGALRVENISKVGSFDLIESTISTLFIRQLGIGVKAQLAITDSRIVEVILDDLKLNGATIVFNSTLGENIYFRKCELDRSKICFNRVLLNSMFAIKHCSYLDSDVDISEVSCPNLNLESEFIDFILNNKKQNSVADVGVEGVEKRIQTLMLLKNKFAQEHSYDLEDGVYYILKNVEYGLGIKKSKWWKKIFLYISYFLQRWVLGWGVRLRNPIMSAVFIVFLCALAYYYLFNLYEENKNVEYLGQELLGVDGAGVFSVLAFFGQQADAKVSGYVPIGLALGEFVMGLTMTTISVGIIIRKLVR